MHRPCLSVFGNLDCAWTMFRSTMVTGYPGQSGPLWLGELVIESTITYGERGMGLTSPWLLGGPTLRNWLLQTQERRE